MTDTPTDRQSVEAMTERVYNWGCGQGSILAPEMRRALLDRAEKAEAERDEALAKLGAPPQWHPIVTAPKDGTPVLLFADYEDGQDQFVGHWDDTLHGAGPHDRFVWRSQSGFTALAEDLVSHWMPLPTPPE